MDISKNQYRSTGGLHGKKKSLNPVERCFLRCLQVSSNSFLLFNIVFWSADRIQLGYSIVHATEQYTEGSLWFFRYQIIKYVCTLFPCEYTFQAVRNLTLYGLTCLKSKKMLFLARSASGTQLRDPIRPKAPPTPHPPKKRREKTEPMRMNCCL